MSEYETNRCAKCYIQTEESLLLICEHNLCLTCAAKNMVREDNADAKYQNVQCEICGTKTTIDQETAMELINSLPQDFKKKELGREEKKTNQQNESLLNISNVSRSFYGQGQNYSGAMSAKKDYCKEHKEELTYFCFECMTRCVCSECVIHGVHKNHDVLNVKRAYPIVVEKMDDLLGHINLKITEISDIQGSLELKKKDLIDSTTSIKKEMNNAFEDIYQKLKRKEREIMEKADMFLQENLNEINTYTRVLQSKVIALNKMIDTINSNMVRKDEVNLLNFYAENNTKITQNTGADIPEIPDFNNLQNLKVAINPESVESLITNLNGLHIEITGLKGFEVNKMINPQKFATRREFYGANNNASISGGVTSSTTMKKNPRGDPNDYLKSAANMNLSFKSISNNNSVLDDIPRKNTGEQFSKKY